MHKLLINDENIKVRYGIGAIRIKVKPKTLYSICTLNVIVIFW